MAHEVHDRADPMTRFTQPSSKRGSQVVPPETGDTGIHACGVESMLDVGIWPLGDWVGKDAIARGLPTTER